MCGRYALTTPPDALRSWFGFAEQPNFPPRYNIAPTQPVAIVHAATDGSRHFGLARWGFLPGFVQDPKDFPLIFNARAEGLAEKASFRNAVRRRRCLVPADAFYEWHRFGSGRATKSQPYLCQRADGTPMSLAGLWETWVGPNGEEVDTACIITTAANAVSAAIHPRLPVVIEPANVALWLDPDELKSEQAIRLLRSPGENIISFTPISDAVNKVDRDTPEIQMPIGAPLDGQPPNSVEHERLEEQPSLF